MIQRIQTIWLLVAAIIVGLTFKLPFYSGNKIKDNTTQFAELNALSHVLLMIISILGVVIPIAAILMFKNRSKQIQICVGGILCSIICLVLYYLQIKTFANGNYSLTSILHIAVLLFYFFAIKAIRNDQKLIKSLDKIR